MSAAPPPDFPTTRQKNVFVLCFDGTGNKFSGTDADSNILKMYRMLDRTDANVYTFYQPGIGTYITSHSMQTTSMAGRIRSWYMKSKDSAVGSSFAEHVMGGYKFLMRYYSCEDDLYFFGFSRGAYTARFLAEMLDHIGLLSAGNEELIRFAWKTYAKWASRKNDGSEASKKEESDLYEFMRGFRETFSRPVRRIRFLGLFDTVNSVPRFESAWMQRAKFPYTARSSAKVIRHAVSIDERRAKFRQDLISGDQSQKEDNMNSDIRRYDSFPIDRKAGARARLEANRREMQDMEKVPEVPEPDSEAEQPDDLDDKQTAATGRRILSIAGPTNTTSPQDLAVLTSPMSPMSPSSEEWRRQWPGAGHVDGQRDMPERRRRLKRRQYSSTSKQQDIEEVWFAGGHADIGGGWGKSDGEKWMLSHAPLVWMVNEATKAGLVFDPVKMGQHKCHGDKIDEYGDRQACPDASKAYFTAFEQSYKTGRTHDCLAMGNGSSAGTVAMWKVMEYLPFRRMDLQSDGSWKPIRWPLPMGETRDIPQNAQIHHSVIKRMECNPQYRPGNLIIGGGGRGVRTANEKYGIGEWEVYKNRDDPITETCRRKDIYIRD